MTDGPTGDLDQHLVAIRYLARAIRMAPDDGNDPGTFDQIASEIERHVAEAEGCAHRA